jgi:membrane-associated protease RseP (regulator of RpoE activity)
MLQHLAQFITCLIIVIILHELAHLIAAKCCGCKVDVFSVGFGKPVLYKIKIGETVYQFTPWIMGGYCQLHGELEYTRKKYAFTSLPYSKKVIIALAGVIVNIVMGLIAIVLGERLLHYNLFYFGYISLLLGASNALPLPALDGSYPFLVLLEKKYGKKKGYALMNKIVQVSMKILMWLNILCLPWLVVMIWKGML